MTQKNSLFIILLLITSCDKTKLKPVECHHIDDCNGLDDDCDGEIDEDATMKPCYPRDNRELLHGECRFGIERCMIKQYSCMGWIEPEEEKCNGKDDNCNGTIDEGISKNLDIVLILDNSCSMEYKTKKLVTATTQWVIKYYYRASLRFALVTAPSSNPDRDRLVTLEKNFSNAKDFIDILQQQYSNVQAGQEATIDAVYDISTSSNPLDLNWSSMANKVIIVYSDEFPQSYKNPELNQKQAIDEAKNNNVSVYVFTDPLSLIFWSDWNSQIFPEDFILEKALDKIISDNSCK